MDKHKHKEIPQYSLGSTYLVTRNVRNAFLVSIHITAANYSIVSIFVLMPIIIKNVINTSKFKTKNRLIRQFTFILLVRRAMCVKVNTA